MSISSLLGKNPYAIQYPVQSVTTGTTGPNAYPNSQVVTYQRLGNMVFLTVRQILPNLAAAAAAPMAFGFVLPVGYRPAATTTFSTDVTSGFPGIENGPGSLQITAGGAITLGIRGDAPGAAAPVAFVNAVSCGLNQGGAVSVMYPAA